MSPTHFFFSPFNSFLFLPQQVTGHHRHPHLIEYKSFAYAFPLNLKMDRLKDLELTMDRFKDLDLSLDRFEDISSNVELVEEYRREGYHPVRLHDVFNERYEVTGKISYGSSSTVWKAKDKV